MAMSVPATPAGQSALVYDLGVLTNDIISDIRGGGHYELLLTDRAPLYLETTLIHAGLPIVLGTLSLLSGMFYCCCSMKLCRRCRASCCKFFCCCSKKLKTLNAKATKKKQKKIRCQYACMSGFSFVMLAFAIIGYVANGQFAESLVGNGETLDISSNWFVELKGFCQTTREPIQFIAAHVSNTIGLVVLPLLKDTAIIADGTSVLTEALGDFSLAYNDRTITATHGANTRVFDCSVCSTISAKVNATKLQISTDTDPLFDEMESSRLSMSTELVQQNESISDICTSVDSLIGAAEEGVDIMAESWEVEVRPEIVKWSNLRTFVFFILFAFPLLPIILTIATMLTKKTIFLTIQNGLTWLTCSLISIIMGAHLIATVVLLDICELNDVILEKGVAHFEAFQNTEGDILQGCFDNTRLIDVFNMSDQLDFGDALTFEFDFNAADAFDLSTLDDLKESMANTTTSTFHGRGDAALQACNDLIAAGQEILTRKNIASASASTYYKSPGAGRSRLESAISAAQITVSLEKSARNKFTQIVRDMQNDMNVIANYKEGLKNETILIEARFADVSLEMQPIMNASNRLLDTRCGFIGTTYRRLDESICLKMAPSIAAMCLSMTLVILMLLPVCCIGMSLKGNLQKREDRDKSSVFAEASADDTDVQML